MSDEAYNKKLADLQQYIPFMENMIGQLKDPKWKPREAQLNKMESLYNMITDKNKKWKYETLLKCEEVILKLQTKVKASKSLTSQMEHQAAKVTSKEQNVTTTVNEIMNVLKFNTARAKLNKMQETNETPKSPSPTPDIGVPCQPKIIPVEPMTNQDLHKKFLIVDPNELCTTWDNKLERYVKEKPDIYSSAAQSLVQKKTVFDRLGPVISDPKKPLLTDDELAQLETGTDEVYVQSASTKQKPKNDMKIELNLKITPRIVPVPCSKPKCPKVDEKIEKKEKEKHSKDVKPKTVKVDGNAQGDIFGSLLSSIDTKIIEETKKKDHKKEHHHHSKHKEDRDKHKDHRHQVKKQEKLEKNDKLKKPERAEKKEEKTQEDYVSSTVDIPMEKPKRLADKYHPKPRLKPPAEEVGSTSRIEEKEEVRLNRDPRRRSPPLSMGFFNQNVTNNERIPRQIEQISRPIDHIPRPTDHILRPTDHISRPTDHISRPIESLCNYENRVDTGWSKYPSQASSDVSNSYSNYSQTSERRYPSYNTNNLAFSQDQTPMRFEPPSAKFEPPPMPQLPRFEHPQSRFEMPRYDNHHPHFEHQRHFDGHPPKRFDTVHYNRFEPQPAQQKYGQPPLLPTPMISGTLLPSPMPTTTQFQRKSFNPFEPLNSEKEKDDPELSGGGFNKRDFGYNRHNYANRSKFDRPKFERVKSERFDRRERFSNLKPVGNRRSVDEEDHKVTKIDSPPETFTSPLESLYSSPKPALSASQARAALDKFRIPKKKQEEKKEEVAPPPQVDVTESKEVEAKSDSDDETPLSRKIKRRLRLKIEDSENESDTEKKIDKIEKSKTKKIVDKPKVNKTETAEKIENKEEEKILEEEAEVESPTRRLRTRPQRTNTQPVVLESPKRKRRRPRRNRRNCRNTRSAKITIDDNIELEEIENEEENTINDEITTEKVIEATEKIEEEPEVKDKEEVKDETTTTTETTENVPEKEKVKNELLADIKKTNLKMEDTDVLQFILQNYKKIKKIFKSDSSSEDEGNSKKKKEKNRDDSPSTKDAVPEVKESAIESESSKAPAVESNEIVSDAVTSKAAEIQQAISVTKEQFTSAEDKVEEKNAPIEDVVFEAPKESDQNQETKDETGDGSQEKTEEVNEDKVEEVKKDNLKKKVKVKVNRKTGKKTKKVKVANKQQPQTVRVGIKKAVKKVIKKKRVGRNTRLAAKSKKARRSELDKLHDDIKEMLMGNEIMTSSGKRSCTMVQKDEKPEVNSEDDTEKVENEIPKTNLKVVLEKSDFAKILQEEEEAAAAQEEDLPPPILEKMVVTPPPNDELRKRVVKRKNKWASGIIQKKVRRRCFANKIGEVEKEDDEDDDYEMSEVIEHDKKYFFVHSAKIGCKLCGFKGKLIVQHYRMSHPESEVLISRIEQGIAEFLINDAVRNCDEYIKVYPETKKVKLTYKCPFCLIFLKDTPNAFYNHLCSHTGEYRYGCYHCPYRTFNAPNVRTHISQSHNKMHKSDYKMIYPDPKVTKYVFGHLCSECNFVQLIRATVEEHSMVYHPGTPEIHRINLGALLPQEELPAPTEDIRSNIDECINAVATGAGELHNPNLTIPAEVKELSVSDLLSQIEDQDQDQVKIKTEPKEIEEDTRPIELAAFMCDTDLDIEHMEDDRAMMTQWINENTRKARTSIADRLQIKLVSEDGSKQDVMNEEDNRGDKEEAVLETTETEKENDEPNHVTTADTETSITESEHTKEADPLDMSIEEEPVEEPEVPKDVPEKEAVDPALAPEESTPSQPSPVVPKPSPVVPVPSVPEKPKKQPELTPSVSFPKMDVMPQKKDNYSVSKIINRLQEKLTTPAKSMSQENSRSATSQKVFSNILDIGPVRVIKAGSVFTFSCKVPNCDFMTDDEKSFAEHCDVMHNDFVYVFSTGKCNVCFVKFEYEGKFVTVHDVYMHMMSAHQDFFTKEIVFKLPHDVPNVLSQGSDSAGPKFPFVITNVTSLASKEVGHPPPLIPLKKGSNNQETEEEIKLPIIASVQSLAPPKSPQPKHLVLTSGAHAKRTLVLRDIPAKDHEKANKKCPTAIAVLLKQPALNALYKCPKYDCSYSTMFSISFQKHLAQHLRIMNLLVRCLYCDYKVLCNFYVIHLEIRHGHCKFGCGDCFYRATSAYFVALHREIEHPNTEHNIVQLKVLSFTNKASNDLSLLKIEDLILNYSCHAEGITGCPFRTLYFEEYLKHAEIIHQVNRSSQGKVILERWLEKDVGPFQCRYCKKATLTYQEMGRHQAVVHFQKECCFYYRKFVPNDTVIIPEQVDLDDSSFINHLVQLPDQVSLCNFKVAEGALTSDADVDVRSPLKTPEIEQDPSGKNLLLDEPEILAVEDDIHLLDESDPLCLDEDVSKEDSIEEKMPAIELTGRALYKCNCGNTYDTMVLLKSHILDCVKKPYECVHCGKERKSVLGLLQHYREHGRRRFKCSLCIFKHWQQEAVRNHMRTVHNVTCAIALPAVAFTKKKVDPETEDYVLRPRQTAKSINDINLKVSTVTTEQSSATVINLSPKLTFGPNDISKLPRQPIYTQPVKCAMCDYETKVKTNMERHLQMHVTQNTVPESAPVNPVPCLDKNEKMFDKMVNLASSSHVGGRMGGMTPKMEKIEVSIPSFVPSNGRFICGAENCKYQCLEEAMLRRHVLAFHSSETTYKCIHCNVNLIEDKTINVDFVLKHLKLHDAHLYRCSICPFMHNLKHKVERHLSDKHPDKPQNLVVLREFKDPTAEEAAPEKEKPWRCGICKFRSVDLSEIKSHVDVKHNIDAKYKCALCPVRSDTVDDFTNHYNIDHEGQPVDFIVSYYKEGEAKLAKSDGEEAFNTTPLWQRNKSIKHIRGILLDESTSKVTAKRKLMKLKRAENDEDEIDSVNLSVSPQHEGKVGRKRKVKQASKDETDDVITIEDEDFEGKKSKSEENPRGKKRRLTLIDLNKLKTRLTGESSPKPTGDALILNETISIFRSDESMEVDVINTVPSPTPDKESMERAIELSLQRSASILSDLDKSILLDEMDSPEKGLTSDIETGQLSAKAQRTAKMRAVHNIATTNVEDTIKFKVVDLSKRNRSKPKKLKPSNSIEIVDEDKTDLTAQDVEKMSKEELLEGNLIGTYGPYGTPWEGKMKCPLCEKFMSKAENEFRYHLYEELRCAPYKCNLCEVTSPSEEIISTHTLTEHKEEGFTVQTLDEQIEGWIRMTIAVQSRIVRLEDKALNTGNFLCIFCNYRSDKNDLRQKHVARHFVEKPFSCNHCGYSSLTYSSLKKHLKCASHCRGLVESISIPDPSNGYLINPYLKNWKKFTEKELQELFDEDRALESENIIKCYYCDFMGTVDQQTEHSQTEHPMERPRVYRYKCNVCPESFVTLVTLNHHFFVKHPGVEASFSMNDDERTKDKFVCEECKISFDEEDDLKVHTLGHSNIFKCIYCPQEFSTWRKIVVHVEFKHVGKDVLFRFMERDILENIDAILKKDNLKGNTRKKTQKVKVDSRINSPAIVTEIQTTPPRQGSSSSVLCIDDSP